MCDGGDAGRHGCRKQGGLTFTRGLLEDGIQIVRESHIEHFIRLVQDDDLHVFELECVAPDMIQRPPGRGDYDIDAAFERVQLRRDGLPPINRQHRDAQFLAIASDGLGHLDCEFPRGHEDERGRMGAPCCLRNALEQGQRKGGGFSGPRSGLPQQVLSA